MIRVPDASTIGGSDHFELYSKTIALRGGRLANAQESLTGAHINLASSMNRMTFDIGIAFEDAARMAIKLLGWVSNRLPYGIASGRSQDGIDE